jgi:hypothetical protein
MMAPPSASGCLANSCIVRKGPSTLVSTWRWNSCGVLILVEPGKQLGPDQSHILIENAQGQPYSPAQVTVSYYLPARKIGPSVENDGEGHYVDQPVTLAFTGQWQVSVTIRSDQFNETTLRIPLTVSP